MSTGAVHDAASPGNGGYMLVVDKATAVENVEHNYAIQIILADGFIEDAATLQLGLITPSYGSGLHLTVSRTSIDVHIYSTFGALVTTIVSHKVLFFDGCNLLAIRLT